MKIIKFASIAFLIGFLLSQFSFKANAQDSRNSREYDVENFSSIHLEGGYKVYLKQGDKPALRVEVQDYDAFDYFDMSSDNSELRIEMREHHFHFERMTLYITFTNLEEITIEGGVKLETNGYIEVDDFYIKVEGGAKIEMDLKANNIKAIGEGGMMFDFEGVARSLDTKVSGAGHIDASELKTKEVTIKIEGVGTGSVYATDELWAKIEGVGKIKYRGNPNVHKNVDGIGVISGN